jgi:hypothetical protein
VQFGHRPLIGHDQRADGRQGDGAGFGYGRQHPVAIIRFHQQHLGQGSNVALRCLKRRSRIESQGHGVVIARTRFQLTRRFVRHQPALRNDHCTCADRVHFFEDVSGDDDDLVLAQIVDQSPDFVFLIRIQAVGRFIENQHLRVMEQRLSESHTSPKSFRQGLDDLVGHRSQRQTFGHRGCALPSLFAAKIADVGHEIQEFGDGHLTVARRAFGKVTDAGLRTHRILQHIVATDADGSAGRGDEAGDHAHGGGLARAIRPEKPEHFARLNRETDAVHRDFVAVSLGEALGFDHRRGSLIVRPAMSMSSDPIMRSMIGFAARQKVPQAPSDRRAFQWQLSDP